MKSMITFVIVLCWMGPASAGMWNFAGTDLEEYPEIEEAELRPVSLDQEDFNAQGDNSDEELNLEYIYEDSGIYVG